MASIKLRPWSMDDLSDLVTFANNEKISRNLTDAFPHPYTEEAGRKFIELTAAMNGKIYAIDFKGRAIGGVGVHPRKDVYRFTAEIGYWLAEPYWGKGIMTEALKKLIKIAFTELPMQRLEACVYDHNPASQRVLNKLGFAYEGRQKDFAFKSGKFTDGHLFRMVREEARNLGYID